MDERIAKILSAAPHAGRFALDWVDACRTNGDLESWIIKAANANSVDLGDDGALFLMIAGHGHWASQDEIDRIVSTIEAGV
jgi:hypothetical protein